jgi:hypothetical protein
VQIGADSFPGVAIPIMIFRLSQKLATKIKAGKLSEAPLNPNEYADWSANLFKVGRTQCIILSNTKSLYSCLMYAQGITNDRRFIQRSLGLIHDLMEDDGMGDLYERYVLPATGTVTFAKSLNRSVIGSMKELTFSAQLAIERDEAPYAAGKRLNGILLSAIAAEGDRGYGIPSEAFRRLSSGKTER